MKRTLIFLVLVLIGLGLYFANSYAAGRAARELDAILAPKFEQAGASYGALEVAPASGTITLKDIALEGEDVSVGEVSVQSTFEDLLAAAKGMPEFLHGLHVTVQDVAIAEEDAVVNLGSGEAHIDALIDIRALQDDPEAWIADLMQQEDVTLNVSGRDWIIRSEDMTRKLSLPSNLVRLDALNASLEKHGGNVATSMDLDSPDFGSMALSAEGNEEELGSLSMEVSDIAFQPDEDLRFALGNATVSLSGAVPIEALMKEDYEELLTERPKMQWSVRVSDFVAEGEELRDEDFPESRVVLETLAHDFEADAERLATTLDFQSNLGNGSMDIDLAIESVDPPVMEFGTFEVELNGLHPELQRALREVPLPLEPRGEDGYGFSYAGPLMGLLGMGM